MALLLGLLACTMQPTAVATTGMMPSACGAGLDGTAPFGGSKGLAIVTTDLIRAASTTVRIIIAGHVLPPATSVGRSLGLCPGSFQTLAMSYLPGGLRGAWQHMICAEKCPPQ